MVLLRSNVLLICIRIIQVVSSYAVRVRMIRSLLLLLDRLLIVNCFTLLFCRHLLVAFLEAGDLLLLVFVDSLHVLHHLAVTARGDHVLITFGHDILLIISLLLALHCPFAFLEESHIQL